jgi:hypothetical protein
MGNWRTVNIVGTCPESEVKPLREALFVGTADVSGKKLGPLSVYGVPSLYGLDDWPAPVMNVTGNLAEQDYAVGDIVRQLRTEVIVAAPGIDIKIHFGDEYESKRVIVTIHARDKNVYVGPGEINCLSTPNMKQLVAKMRRLGL